MIGERYGTSATPTPSPNSTVESEGNVPSEGALIHVDENAMEASWKDVFPDNSDMDDKLVSELNTLVSLSIASLRHLSFAATTVLGVFAVSVSLLEVLPCSVALSSMATTSGFSAFSSISPLSECFEESPAVNIIVEIQNCLTTNVPSNRTFLKAVFAESSLTARNFAARVSRPGFAPYGTVLPFVDAHTFCASLDGPRTSRFLRTAVICYLGKTDLSKSYWNPKRK